MLILILIFLILHALSYITNITVWAYITYIIILCDSFWWLGLLLWFPHTILLSYIDNYLQCMIFGKGEKFSKHRRSITGSPLTWYTTLDLTFFSGERHNTLCIAQVASGKILKVSEQFRRLDKYHHQVSTKITEQNSKGQIFNNLTQTINQCLYSNNNTNMTIQSR